jgi:KipI family sensor histidine kinase inhibitor
VRRILPCGTGALLVECDEPSDALGLWQRLTSDPPDGVREAVPGARTVLVLGDVAALGDALLTLAGTPPALAPPEVVVVPVRYDGADLEAVARHAGISTGDLVARHCAGAYTVAFGGFVPGFAYLTGLDRALRMARRDTPRPSVPAGSVAIADEYTGVYPVESPGGWHLLGTTTLVVFDPDRTPAAALVPGMRVCFEAIG